MSTPAARAARRVEADRSPLLGVPRRLVSLLWLPIVLFLLFWSPAQQVTPTWLYAGLVPAVAGWVVFALYRHIPPVATVLTCLALAGGGIALLAGSDGWTTSAAFPMMAVFVAALRLPYRTALFVDVPVIAVTTIVVGPYTSVWDALLVVTALTAMVLFWIGRRDSARRVEEHERALVADARAREEHARAEAIADRARVARDVHDVLAHSLSALAVQLQGARLMALRDGAAPDTIAQIERAQRLASDGITEARRAVRALREGPAPVDVAGELRELGRAHPDATVEIDDGLRFGAREGETVLRTAQEALSNARKHAPGAPVTVRLHRDGDDTAELEVLDVAGAPPPPGDGGGSGLVGMAERAALVGAQLRTGPTPDGWRVLLRLPAHPPDDPTGRSADAPVARSTDRSTARSPEHSAEHERTST